MSRTWSPATYADGSPQTCPRCDGQTEFLEEDEILLAERCKPCGWTIWFDDEDDDPSVEWD